MHIQYKHDLVRTWLSLAHSLNTRYLIVNKSHEKEKPGKNSALFASMQLYTDAVVDDVPSVRPNESRFREKNVV